MKSSNIASLLISIGMAATIGACTGDLSEKIDSLTASQTAIQEEIKTLTESQDSLRTTLIDIKSQNHESFEQITEMFHQVDSLTKKVDELAEKTLASNDRTTYELSDVEYIGFEPTTNTTLLEQFAGGFLGGFIGVNPNDGLIESWEGSFTFEGEQVRVIVYVYDKNVEGSSAFTEAIGSMIGTPILTVRNLMLECDSQRVCEFLVDSLKSGVKPKASTEHSTSPQKATLLLDLPDAETLTTVEKIGSLYANNRSLADSTYKGKIISATGTIKKVFTKGNKIEVELYGTDPYNRIVVCKVPESNRASTVALQSGNDARIKGKVLGIPGFSNVVMDPCVID